MEEIIFGCFDVLLSVWIAALDRNQDIFLETEGL